METREKKTKKKKQRNASSQMGRKETLREHARNGPQESIHKSVELNFERERDAHLH